MQSTQSAALKAGIDRQTSALVLPAYRMQVATFRASFFRLNCVLKVENPSPFKVRQNVSNVVLVWKSALKMDKNLRRGMNPDDFAIIKDEIKQWAEYRRDIAYKAIQFATDNFDCYQDVSPFTEMERMIAKEIKFIHSLL